MSTRKVRHRRPGISEVMGAVVTIAITLVAGSALFGYVNGQAAVNENALGVQNGHNVNFLNERFVVALVAYNAYPSSSSITIYLYNSGQLDDNFVSIEVFNSSAATAPGDNAMNILYDSKSVTDLNHPSCNIVLTPQNYQNYESAILGNGTTSFSVPIGSIKPITLTLPSCYTSASLVAGTFKQGLTYSIKVIGLYENIVTYYQVM